MEHWGILSMPDLKFILIFDQNDVFDHFLIFTPFLRLIFAIYRETLLRSYNYAWSSLPFGWKYSLVIGQRLMRALGQNSVFDLKVLPFTYLDDVLAAGARRDLKRAVRRLRGSLQRARFVVSPKSSLEPTRVLDFVGKIFDT